MAAFARSVGAALFGVDARLVDIQVFLRGQGETGVLRIVGMGDGALKEGGERIRGAFLHAGYAWPQGAVTVNLAPASARKEGPGLDLPITLALLQACGSLGRADVLAHTLVLGELTLDGRVRPVRGVLAAAESARRQGLKEALVPTRNAAEAAAVPGLVVRAVDSLEEAVGQMQGRLRLSPVPPTPWAPARSDEEAHREVRGQPFAVRAALLAAAGGHNLLLTGAPGAGKTLLARALRGLLPPLTREEALEVTRIHSAAGLVEGGLVADRPFRAPHHTTSLAGLVGGGAVPRPGEVSLAHLGVLFLDELAEFPRPVLEGLRQPIEDGEIVVGRAAGRARFPSEIVIVAAMNPCSCVALLLPDIYRPQDSRPAAAGVCRGPPCPAPAPSPQPATVQARDGGQVGRPGATVPRLGSRGTFAGPAGLAGGPWGSGKRCSPCSRSRPWCPSQGVAGDPWS